MTRKKKTEQTEVKTEVVSIKITPSFKNRIKQAAVDEHRSMANFVEYVLDKYMKDTLKKKE